MAKKKKQRGKRHIGGELQAALDALEVVEQDVAKVRDNLRTFRREIVKHMSGGSHHIPAVPPRPKKASRK
jgi:hypothetical protein